MFILRLTYLQVTPSPSFRFPPLSSTLPGRLALACPVPAPPLPPPHNKARRAASIASTCPISILPPGRATEAEAGASPGLGQPSLSGSRLAAGFRARPICPRGSRSPSRARGPLCIPRGPMSAPPGRPCPLQAGTPTLTPSPGRVAPPGWACRAPSRSAQLQTSPPAGHCSCLGTALMEPEPATAALQTPALHPPHTLLHTCACIHNT